MPKKLIFVLVGLVLVLAVIAGLNIFSQGDGNLPVGSGEKAAPGMSLGSTVPHKLGGLDLVGLEAGQEAVDNISRLHGTKIDIIDGLVARYTGGNSDFILWVSESRDDEEARYLFEIMDEKMPSSPMFKNRTEIDIAGRTVIYVTGAGMENYYWVEGTKNYWVGIYAGDALELVSLVMENF
jgi:hypothetical protein